MWKVFVFFLCPSPELAAEAAHGFIQDPNILPAHCSWMTGQAEVLKIEMVIELSDGTVVAIGKFRTPDGRVAWSAGKMPELG